MHYSAKDSLFVTAPAYDGLEKVAAITLSRDGADWERQISDALHREHPFIQEHNISFHMTRVDAQTGAGVGSIRIDNKVLLPIIIDRFKLAPLDVYWFEDKLQPLTRDALESALQDATLGQPVAPGQGETSDVSLYSRTQAPFDGKYTYAALTKAAASSKRVGTAIDAAFKSRAESEAAILASSPMQRVLRDMVTGKHHKTAAKACAAKARLARRQDGKSYQKVASAGLWRVPGSDLRERAVLAIDYYITPDLRLDDSRRLLLGVDKVAGYALLDKQTEVAGRHVASMSKFAALDGTASQPRQRASGFFVKFAANGAIACGPFTIDYQTGDSFAAHTNTQQAVTLTKISGLRVPLRDERGVCIPADWQWLEGGSTFSPADVSVHTPRSGIHKVAGQLLLANGRLVVRGLPDFATDGEETTKTAAALRERFDAESVDALINTLVPGEPTDFCIESEDAPLVKAPTVPVVDGPSLLKAAFHIRANPAFTFPIGRRLLKVAAVTDDEAANTVDALLGLNFLNPENIYRFAEKADQITIAKEAVAKLLLASRLGLQVDSRPLRTAMFALDAVERDLRELQNSTEIPEVRG